MRTKILLLAVGMLLAGSFNTISTKYQDLYVVGYTKDGTPLTFKHPAVQSLFMFMGECLCLIPYFYLRYRKQQAKAAQAADGLLGAPDSAEIRPRSFYVKRIMVFAIPALCDACATTLLNIGLYYTYASVYQMLRGTMVLFAGMFTILILRRKLHIHHWLGMTLIMAGAALVGASSVLQGTKTNHDAHRYSTWERFKLTLSLQQPPAAGQPPANAADSAAAPLFGDILVVMAQLATALQFILEEKYLKKYKVPTLMAVGVEGCWGVLLCCFVLPVLTVYKAPDGLPLDDAVAAAKEIAGSKPLLIAIVSSTVSIAFFNFFGISVTKKMSGAARATIDACRTIFIWLYALQVGWEKFHPLEVVGFVVLLSGTSLYNEILRSCLPSSSDTQHQHRHSQQSPPGDDVTEPLLQNHQDQPPIHHSDPVPVPVAPSRPRMASGQRVQRPMNSSDVYTMARSMRLGASALSPHSLDSYDAAAGSFGPSYDAGAVMTSESPGGESSLTESESPLTQAPISGRRQ